MNVSNKKELLLCKGNKISDEAKTKITKYQLHSYNLDSVNYDMQ